MQCDVYSLLLDRTNRGEYFSRALNLNLFRLGLPNLKLKKIHGFGYFSRRKHSTILSRCEGAVRNTICNQGFEMEERVEYWSKRWQNEDAPWHIANVNRFLASYFDQVSKIKEGKLRIFVPLCGKTQDLKWIYDQGHEVVGVDGVEKPILEFFQEQGLTYTKGNEGGLQFYVSDDGRLKIYHSDLFLLNPEVCGKFDGVWDRGSLVALLAEERDKYAKLLKSLLNENFGYLIHTVNYEQSQYPGPPLSVPVEEMKRLFGDVSEVETLLKINTKDDPTALLPVKFHGNITACYENIFLLKPKTV